MDKYVGTLFMSTRRTMKYLIRFLVFVLIISVPAFLLATILSSSLGSPSTKPFLIWLGLFVGGNAGYYISGRVMDAVTGRLPSDHL